MYCGAMEARASFESADYGPEYTPLLVGEKLAMLKDADPDDEGWALVQTTHGEGWACGELARQLVVSW